jgi:hypothetical protein
MPPLPGGKLSINPNVKSTAIDRIPRDKTGKHRSHRLLVPPI